MNIDSSTIVNLIISGLIAFVFGALSTWITYKNERKRDDIAWEREKEKLQQQVNSDLGKLHEEVKQDLYKQRELVVRSEILPTIWKNLLDALGKLAVVTAFFRESPDFTYMSDEALNQFLKTSRLNEIHKKQLVTSPDRNKYYQQTIFWYEFDDAQNQFNVFHNHLLYNKIYLDDFLFEKLSELDQSLSKILMNTKFQHQYPSDEKAKLHQEQVEFNSSAESMLKEIEKAIQKSLDA